MVVFAVICINFLWLVPMAIAVGMGLVPGVVGVVVAYLPLILIACLFRAGVQEEAPI
jgi:Fuc2NAc and GlcNAc transferase